MSSFEKNSSDSINGNGPELRVGSASFPSPSSSALKSPAGSIASASHESVSTAYPSSFRRRLIEKRVAVMSDGKFTYEAPEEGSGAESGIPRRHPLCKGAGGLIASYHPEIRTMWESFNLSVQKNSHQPLFGTRYRGEDGKFSAYRWKTYGEVFERIKAISMAMQKGFQMSANACVGLFSINREEWVITEQACFSACLVTVPLYDTLGEEAISYICSQTEMEIIFTSRDKLNLLKSILPGVPSIKRIVSFDEPRPEDSFGGENGPELIYFGDLLRSWAEVAFEPRPPQPTDLCTICYTSGTTGRPKGVMLPHAALLADASACLALCGYGAAGFTPEQRSLFELRPDDVHISYLPLAHIFERIVMTALITVGAGIGFYQGDVTKIMEDLAELRPTVFVSVPRLFSRVYDKVWAGVKEQPAWRQWLFECAFSAKVKNLRENGQLKHWLWDGLVFEKIRNSMGGRVRAMLTGSAPLSPEVMEFLRVCFGCEVYEGYGQTETSAGSCLTIRHDWTLGHVGIPVPSNEIKLVSVPDMNYFADDPTCPRGEICVRGPSCFVGYYRDPENTQETLDEAGWVHSGDIGEWDVRGRLKIIDRKKNLFKLSQGEYVSPEKVEAVICRSPLVAQCFLYGDPLESAPVAIIVPDQEGLSRWIRKRLEKDDVRAESTTPTSEKGNEHDLVTPGTNSGLASAAPSNESMIARLSGLSFADQCCDPAVLAVIQGEIEKFGRKGSKELKGFEIPKSVYLESELFSLQNGLLTATFKLKRFEARQKYEQVLKDLYAQANTTA